MSRLNFYCNEKAESVPLLRLNSVNKIPLSIRSLQCVLKGIYHKILLRCHYEFKTEINTGDKGVINDGYEYLLEI